VWELIEIKPLSVPLAKGNATNRNRAPASTHEAQGDNEAPRLSRE